jgi:hypothetical protein
MLKRKQQKKSDQKQENHVHTSGGTVATSLIVRPST